MTDASRISRSGVPNVSRFADPYYSNVRRRTRLALWERALDGSSRITKLLRRSRKMDHNESVDQKGDDKGITSPDAAHPGEATSPPGNPDTDEQAVEEGREKLDQAGGGH